MLFLWQLHPSVLFRAISLIYGSQSFRLVLKPQNHTKAKQFSPHSLTLPLSRKADNRMQYGGVLQAQMQVIKGYPPPPRLLTVYLKAFVSLRRIDLKMVGQFNRVVPFRHRSGNIDQIKSIVIQPVNPMNKFTE